jgi:hypothetical protein
MLKTKYTLFVAAAVLYLVFAVYLYQHYFKGFSVLHLRDLFVANTAVASLGCYVLSRRWVAGFAESFFAGALYGFGPFSLGLAKFHPTAGFLAAAVPWLFCPAVFGPKAGWRWLRVPFSVLPFLAIVLFFQLVAHFRLYPIPIQLKLQAADVAGLFAPLIAAQQRMTLLGFYHIPLTGLIMGFAMLVAARRLKVVLILAVATILAFCDSLLAVSPIIWLAVSMLCGSVIIGAGMQGLVCAGPADHKWILMDSVVMGTLAIATLLLATECFATFASSGSAAGNLFVETAKMYILGAITMAVLFFIVRANLRTHVLRRILLCAAMGTDIFFGATFVIDKILFS